MAYADLLQSAGEFSIRYLKPPFHFNAAQVAQYPVEVTGYRLLQDLAQRLGWNSLQGKRLLDFGCGVRFAQTIHNLNLSIGLYAGVDTNPAPIEWLRSEINDPRFSFTHLNMRNQLYNPAGGNSVGPDELVSLGLTGFDAACMFSVITHQVPQDAELIFTMLERSVSPDGALYFTSFLDPETTDYREGEPDRPCMKSTYNPDFLFSILKNVGWEVTKVYPMTELHLPIVVCRKR